MSLVDACLRNDLAEVKRLVHSGCDVNQRRNDEYGFTGLIAASQKGYLSVVTWLVEDGNADTTIKGKKYGQSCLYSAARYNHLSVVRFLALKNPHLLEEPENDGRTPLWTASFCGCEKVIEFLLHENVNVEKKGCEFQMTPLLAASQEGKLQTVKLLVQKGKANIHAVDKVGRTSLFLAARDDHVPVIEYLLSKGAEIDQQGDFNNRAPLSIACKKGSSQAVRFLISQGANVELTDKYQHTPLMIACEKGHLEVVKTLIEHGKADKTKRNGTKTALDFAFENKHPEIVAYLTTGVQNDQMNLYKEYRKGRKLGEGGFGAVFLYSGGTENVAVKEIIKRNDETWNELDNEIKALKRVEGHENILTYLHHEVDQRANLIRIFMELCDMDLEKYVKSKQRLSIGEIYDMILQISNGLKHVHDRDIIHRDLKPQNVLIKLSSDGKVRCKITDFGFARIKQPNENSSEMSLSVGGTRKFMAPEMLKALLNEAPKMPKGYPYSVDIYSLGVMIFWLTAKKVPFENVSDVFADDFDAKDVIRSNVPVVELHNLLMGTMQKEPRKRPNINDVIGNIKMLEILALER